MNGVFEIAGSGLSAQQRALSIVANNVSNINTPAFKRSDVRYADLSAQLAARGMAGSSVSGGGVAVRAADEIDRQGEIEQTGRDLDIALDGRGFLELMGPGGQVMLWRGGPLVLTRDGYLGASESLPFVAMIQVPADATQLRVSRNGDVSAITSGSDGERLVLGNLQLAMPDSEASLKRVGGGLYQVEEGLQVRRSYAGEDGAAVFVQGALERSNVNLNEEMIRLMVIQRAYAANAQLVQAADQFMGIVNGLRRA